MFNLKFIYNFLLLNKFKLLTITPKLLFILTFFFLYFEKFIYLYEQILWSLILQYNI